MKQKFKTIAKFQYSSEAQIVKGRLEAEGIEVFLFDEFTIDTDPLISNAIGGVKLKVLSDQVLKAQHILDTIHPYSLDDNGDNLICPNCKSDKIELFSTVKDIKSLFWFIFGFLFSALPFYAKHQYTCESCKTHFDLK